MRRRTERLLATSIGVLVFLVALEIGLRVMSAMYWRPSSLPGAFTRHDVSEQMQECPDCPRILCVGDSYTYGIGASPGNDYPSWLERVLLQREGRRFVVINGGIGGASSSIVARELPGLLEAVEPDLVVVMAGNSNLLDFAGYLEFLYESPFLSSLAGHLYRIRVLRYSWYVLAELRDQLALGEPASWRGFESRQSLETYLAWKQQGAVQQLPSPVFERAVEELRRGYPERAIEHLVAGIEKTPGDARLYWGMGLAHQMLWQLDLALDWYLAGLDIDPDDPALYCGVGEVYVEKGGPWPPIIPHGRGRNPVNRLPVRDSWLHPRDTSMSAISAFEMGIQAEPRFSGNWCGLGTLYALLLDQEKSAETLMEGIQRQPDNERCFASLVNVSILQGQRDSCLAFLEKQGVNSRTARRFAHVLRSERDDYRAWIRSDLRATLRLIKRQGASSVVMEYPQNTTVNAVFSDLARAEGVVLVPSQQRFSALLASGTEFRDLFVADGHCNDRGYQLLATGLYDTLQNSGLLASIEQGRGTGASLEVAPP